MSAESQPISAERFAAAVQDLPAENVYAKARELENSIAHLERSNRQLQEYVDSIRADTSLAEATRQEGDRDCSDAIDENRVVIERQKERIGLLKHEIERRGASWHDGDSNGAANGHGDDAMAVEATHAEQGPERQAGGRLTDDELRRQLRDRMGDGDDDADGMHL